MKLKYYLRGLAVGILLTTIVLTIANAGNRPLTDAQIRQRARELGMIESDSVRLSELQGGGTLVPESNGQEGSFPSDVPESNMPENSSERNLPETDPERDISENDMSVETLQSPENESNSAETVPQQETSSQQEVSVEPDAEPVIFQIKSGASSSSVSKELAAAGLIEDAAAFDAFLCNNGYSKKIHTGTYQILPGTSEEDIAKIIAQ